MLVLPPLPLRGRIGALALGLTGCLPLPNDLGESSAGARRLTKDLRDVSKDEHLSICRSASILPPKQAGEALDKANSSPAASQSAVSSSAVLHTRRPPIAPRNGSMKPGLVSPIAIGSPLAVPTGPVAAVMPSSMPLT
jgi:hypothetical protein